MRLTDQAVICVLWNPGFPQYVKIDYTTDLEAWLKKLNWEEAVPQEYLLYAYYETKTIWDDERLYRVLCLLHADFESNSRGKRGFYMMSPQRVYEILEASAVLSGTIEKLYLNQEVVEQVRAWARKSQSKNEDSTERRNDRREKTSAKSTWEWYAGVKEDSRSSKDSQPGKEKRLAFEVKISDPRFRKDKPQANEPSAKASREKAAAAMAGSVTTGSEKANTPASGPDRKSADSYENVPFRFRELGIHIGEKLRYVLDEDVQPVVISNSRVRYQGLATTLDKLLVQLTGVDAVCPLRYFTFCGELLLDRYVRMVEKRDVPTDK